MYSRNKIKDLLILGLLVPAVLACSIIGTVTPPPVVVTEPPTGATEPPVAVTEPPVVIPPELPVITSPVLLSIDFKDDLNGWAIANGYVLRTLDGGSTWYNATPAGAGTVDYSTQLFALSANTAWVLMPNADYTAGTLYRTSDGGLTWDSFSVPFARASIQFLDEMTGRVMADRGAGMGSNAVEIYQSADGGATWVSVFHNDPSQAGSSDSLPLSGIKNGMTFIDASNGWVTGSIPADGNVYLYVTHDGGNSWSQQSIPLPAGYEMYQYMPQPPVFFGQDGFLPLTIYMTSTYLTFYTTNDGGATWGGDPEDSDLNATPGSYSFADSTHGWTWDGGSNMSNTYIWEDGNMYWGGMGTSLDLSGILSQLEFVSGPGATFTGWALTSVDDTTGRSQLYKTTDNGVSWSPLIP